MRDNQSVHDLLAAYALGALDADEVMQVEAYLAQSAEARAELKALSEVVALLPYAAQPVEPPATVRRQLFARIAASQPAEKAQAAPVRPPAVAAAPPLPVRPRRNAPPLMSAVLAVMLLVVGLGGFAVSLQIRMDEMARNSQISVAELNRTRQAMEERLAQMQQVLADTQASQQALSAQLAASRVELANLSAQLNQEQQVLTFISAPGVATRVLEATTAEVQAAGEMYMYPGHSEAVVLFRGLPPLAAGQVYQFWLANAEGQIAAGTVLADADGLARLHVVAPREVNAFTQVMLTVEPVGGSATPSNQVVLEGSL